MKALALRMIRVYQHSGGGRRWFGVICNFTPTCSEYTKQAIDRYGLRKGIQLGFHRIRRCNDPDCPHTIQDPLP